MTAASTDGSDAGSVEVVRSEQRLVPGVERRVGGRVRVAKRVVTEERTLTVTVRREELVVEHLPVAEGVIGEGTVGDQGGEAVVHTGAARAPGSDAVLTLVLSEEVPEVTVRAVPRERVRVHVDRVTTEEVVTGDVARERVDVDLDVASRTR
jgi:stress response protein YsnF